MQCKSELLISLSAHASLEIKVIILHSVCLSNTASSKLNKIVSKDELIHASVRCSSVRTGIFSLPENFFFFNF